MRRAIKDNYKIIIIIILLILIIILKLFLNSNYEKNRDRYLTKKGFKKEEELFIRDDGKKIDIYNPLNNSLTRNYRYELDGVVCNYQGIYKDNYIHYTMSWQYLYKEEIRSGVYSVKTGEFNDKDKDEFSKEARTLSADFSIYIVDLYKNKNMKENKHKDVIDDSIKNRNNFK